jgi:hypothetical protein
VSQGHRTTGETHVAGFARIRTALNQTPSRGATTVVRRPVAEGSSGSRSVIASTARIFQLTNPLFQSIPRPIARHLSPLRGLSSKGATPKTSG